MAQMVQEILHLCHLTACKKERPTNTSSFVSRCLAEFGDRFFFSAPMRVDSSLAVPLRVWGLGL